MTKFSHLARAMLAAAAIAFAGSALAAPLCADRAVRLVIPQPAGGVGDVVGRLLAEKASTFLEQPIVVENKAGASTTIGTAAVAGAKPDGCTILHMTNTAVVASAINDKLPYNLERDLVPVVGVGSFPMALAVTENSKYKTFGDFVAAAKSPEGLTYSTGGPGTMAHLASLRMLKEIGGKGTHVPYRGNAPALQGLLGGDVNFMFPTTFEAMPLVQANKVRVLGVTADARLPAFPSVPTMKELGFGDLTPRIWYAFLLPAGSKPEVVARVHDAFAKAVMDPGIQTQLRARGYIPEALSTADTTAFIKSEYARWKKVAQENNVSSLD
ncbi:tripartite tricarboxylate transporter substrate binding protein [Variovorax sp. LjRoot178]|uniref:tripartite tricarboxylate transporter substrate binding protein n=1 Tax=Variovorax sp. LjRoot178 TaxID=3342277 RepID=UPI003ED0ED14